MPSRRLRATPATPRERVIPLQPATAKNLVALVAAHRQAASAFAVAEQRLADSLRSILTEHGIEEAEPLHVQDTAPCSLTVRVTKEANDSKDSKEARP